MYITIRDGNTGEYYTISNEEDFNYLIDNFNTIKVKKDKISLWYMGYGYDITFYDYEGDIVSNFIVNSANYIRKGPFFYITIDGLIEFDYIENMIDGMEN